MKQLHKPCPDCGSRDALTIYDDGKSFCFSCRKLRKGENRVTNNSKLTTGLTVALKDRNIKEETCRKYGVTVVGTEDDITRHVYPYFKDDTKVANKIRTLPKSFNVEGTLSNQTNLFGQHLFAEGGRAITIYEGELDAMAGYELTGSQFACVSVPNGAQSAVQAVKSNLEYLETFQKVVLCFDNDTPGQEAAKQVANVLSLGKCKIMSLELKDAGEYLKLNKHKEFVKAWYEAKTYTPDGIIASSKLLERIKNKKEVESVPYPWDGLNKVTYGIRKGELVTVTADTGRGKTQFLREIIYNISQEKPEAKIGTFFLEEQPEDSGQGLMSVYANVPFHLPDAVYEERQLDEAFERVLGDDKFYFYDSFGSTSIDNILNRVRYYAKGLDCDYIIIDHLSIIVSDMSNGDERKALDEIATKLKTLTIELNVAMIAVIHTNRQGQIRGSAGVEQLSNIIIHLDRDVKHPVEEIRNTTTVTIWKNRFCGKTGLACYLKYNENNGRMTEVDEPEGLEDAD